MNIEKTIDIMEPGAVLTDQQLAQIQADADLREACQDIMTLQGQLAPQPDTEVALERFHTRTSSTVNRKSSIVNLKSPTVSRKSSLGFLAIAAAFIGILLLLHLGNAFDSPKEGKELAQLESSKSSTTLILSEEIVRPEGKADAVLTLPAKKEKSLSIFGYELPTLTHHPTTVSTQTITIPLGSSLELTLGDGTKVFMHPGARLVYPEQFVGSERRVTLTGEAYFCVAHDAERPFVVSTPRGDIRDYGTEFNVNADETLTEVVLVEGSVGVTPSGGREHLVKPGQKLSIVNSQLTIENADTDPFLAWRDGYFYYDQQKLGDIVKQLAAFYNLHVVCYNSDLLSLRMRYIIPRSSTATYAISILDRLQSGHISLEGNRIVVK